MKTTQTIELNNNERLTLGKALKIMDEVSNIVGIPMVDVFEYFAGVSDSTDDGHYEVKALHYIAEMK